MIIEQCFSVANHYFNQLLLWSFFSSQIYLFRCRIQFILEVGLQAGAYNKAYMILSSRIHFIYHNKLSSQFKFFFYQPISEFYTTVLRIYWVDIYLDSSSFFTRRQYAHHIIWETCKDFILLQEVLDTTEIIFGFFLHSMDRYMSAYWSAYWKEHPLQAWQLAVWKESQLQAGQMARR